MRASRSENPRCATLGAMKSQHSWVVILGGIAVAASSARADGTGHPAPGHAASSTAPVIGGSAVPVGMWRDTAAIYFGSQQECSGVLISPTVVLTAGHCADPSLDHILVGSNDLGHPELGETIVVQTQVQYPNSQQSFDVTLLKLATPSTIPPRAIATGWARLDIVNGAQIALVGFGAIDKNANDYIDQMQQGFTTITDATCANENVGCNTPARPAGELGAGGMGIDTCPGDSGGPLFLQTSYGDFLAGITSRGYSTDQFECSEGGIYERPDAIMDWIETNGGPVTHGPEPTATALTAVNGDGDTTLIADNDPLSATHTYSITVPPTHGTAAVTADGHVRVCTDATYQGSDSVTVDIVDSTTPTRHLAFAIPITVTSGTAPASCSLDLVSGSGSGGCDSSGGAGGLIAMLVPLGLLALRRRNA